MSKKKHDIDFERTMIEKNKHAILFKVNIPQFNSLDFDIYLHITDDFLTLYKKVPDNYGKVIRIYFIDSVELDALPMGKIVFDHKMITRFESDKELFWMPENMLCGPRFEGNPADCAFKSHKEPILVNDDGEPIRTRKRVTIKETIGLSLKVKEYYHTGWLK